MGKVRLEDIVVDFALNEIYLRTINNPLLGIPEVREQFNEVLESCDYDKNELLKYLKFSKRVLDVIENQDIRLKDTYIINELPYLNELFEAVKIPSSFHSCPLLVRKSFDDFLSTVIYLVDFRINHQLIEKYCSYYQEFEETHYGFPHDFISGINQLLVKIYDPKNAKELGFKEGFCKENLDLYFSSIKKVGDSDCSKYITKYLPLMIVKEKEIVEHYLSLMMFLQKNNFSEYTSEFEGFDKYRYTEPLDFIGQRFIDLDDITRNRFLDDINLISNIIGYSDHEFLFAYFKKLLSSPISPKEEQKVNDSLDIILGQRKIIKDIKSKIIDEIVHKSKHVSDTTSRLLDISQLIPQWYMTKMQVKSFVNLIDGESIKNTQKVLLKDIFYNLLSRLNKSEYNLYDLGCGDGTKSIYICKFLKSVKNINLNLIDISLEMIKVAEKNAYLHSLNYSSSICDLANFSFDKSGSDDYGNILLFLGQTLGNFESPEEIIKRLSNLIQKDDYLVLEIDLEKHFSYYKISKDFMFEYVKSLGFEKNDLEYYIKNDESGIEAYFILKNDKSIKFETRTLQLRGGDKILVGKSKRFDKDSLVKSFENYSLKTDNNLIIEEDGKLLACFYRA